MATYSSWLPNLVARLPGATLAVIKQELTAAISEFCLDALPWQQLSDPYTVNANEPSVSVNPVDNRSKCIRVVRAFWGTQELAPMAWKPAAATTPGWPLAYTCEGEPTTVSFIPVPNTGTDEFYATLALAPVDASVWVPDFFVTNYFEVILDNALGRLYNHPFKPYSDVKKAAYHMKRYRNKTIEARVIAKRGNTPDGQQWGYPEFGV